MKKLIFLLLISTNLFARQSPDEIANRIDSIFKAYQSNTPGCAIAVVKEGKMVFSKGYGLASLDYDIPNTANTVFDIASVSKQFAAYAISTLIEQGKLSLKDDIRKYLPEVPDFGKTITIDHLVHHTSGLRDWTEALAVAGWRGEEVYSMADIMRMVKRQNGLDFPPGSKYQYSNTGYNLLAQVVAKLSGKTFGSWTQDNIYTPLGMSSTQFLENHRKIIKNIAYSYYPANATYVKANSQLTALGSSSMFTSANDFGKWMIHFLQALRDNKPIYKRMLETGTLDNGERIPYAFGLVVGEYKGVKHVSHTGSWAGYRSVSNYYPDQNLGIVVLANHATFSRSSADEVAELFLKDQLKPQSTSAAPGVSNTDSTVVVDSTRMKSYTGLYKLGPGWLVNITFENGVLMTRATDEDKYQLDAKNDSSFWVPAYGAAMTFNKDSRGKVYQLSYKAIKAPRVVPFVANPKTFSDYEGEYYSSELSAVYRVYRKADKLFIEHMRHGEHELKSIGNDEFFGNAIGEIRFDRASKKVSGFGLSAGRIKDIPFVKR
ncbi:class A beta-lactamase-related serine hydrolase [Segetibacter sp. 3557_3]|uniref:serine hydrolase domain-containing protein n=1 Tax=Segetibacter sp. 3557_3 TaxID=2547429 RepID=UPI0010586F76|nr:serine hydrolase domain-containing protein [Segetibacter sp. 3557_3]TDH24579.1 class A beta-lactamase-related serine hydrolase [Segetibacter sp. 3557_3]